MHISNHCHDCQGANLVELSDDRETSIRRRLELFRDTEADVINFIQNVPENYRVVSCEDVRDVRGNEQCLRTLLGLISV